MEAAAADSLVAGVEVAVLALAVLLPCTLVVVGAVVTGTPRTTRTTMAWWAALAAAGTHLELPTCITTLTPTTTPTTIQ